MAEKSYMRETLCPTFLFERIFGYSPLQGTIDSAMVWLDCQPKVFKYVSTKSKHFFSLVAHLM